ncbi:MAG: hybrid sensor histidine kinase/response regulator [Candidatus Obscuribacterales bacterium]|jgi:signal transduction histidine kinase|nr:hybrid sensor histidine kinase/response regulator [Candidatus Obscuribacterales bacterium]
MNGVLQPTNVSPTKTIRLMLVEDDKHYLAYLEASLQNSINPRFELFAFQDLHSALREFGKTNPDLVLTDLSLPDSDGLDSLGSLLEVSGNVPVIVLSGSTEESEGLQAVRMGAQDFLIKQRVRSESLIRCILYTIERRKNDEFRQRQCAIKDFIETLAHDLSVPMIGSEAVLDSLLANADDRLAVEQVELINALKSSNTKQLALVKKLIKVYQYESECEHLEMELLCTQTIIEECLERLDCDSVKLSVQSPGKLPRVYGNRAAIFELFSSLLDNAVKYSNRESEVSITFELADGMLRTNVQNIGERLPEEFESGNFHNFWKSIPGKRYVARTGLGLYLCHRIVCLHNGRLICSSSNERNTVAVLLPIACT